MDMWMANLYNIHLDTARKYFESLHHENTQNKSFENSFFVKSVMTNLRVADHLFLERKVQYHLS